MSIPSRELLALDRKPVLITTADGTPIVSGLLKTGGQGESPETNGAVRLEFVLRNVTFMIQVPDPELPALVRSFKGGHYTYALPGGSQFLLQPYSNGEPGAAPA